MNKETFLCFTGTATLMIGIFFSCDSAFAQVQDPHRHRHQSPRADFHAGIHSGSWTLKREQILEEESGDHYRSCDAPYCNRCSKHLADYGHEYQLIGGPSQRQFWYPGTAGSIAHVTQRCYDEHGCPYLKRGRPGAVMSWEYQRYLNHAICEQVRARNAVALEEAAEDRAGLLTQLRDLAFAQSADSEEAFNRLADQGCIALSEKTVAPCASSDSGKTVRVGGTSALCEYCAAKALYLKDREYLAEVEKELALATFDWRKKSAIADEKVRIALLSKEDADKATRYKRIQHKPPKYKEVLAAREAAEARKKTAEESTN